MDSALADIMDVVLLRSGFNTNSVMLGTSLYGLAAGVVGVFTLLRKRSLVADAVSHASLPGIAIMFLIASALGAGTRSVPLLLAGAGASGALGVLAIHLLRRWTRLKDDAAIAIVLSSFFGFGIVMLSVVQNESPTGAAGLHHLLFGQAAAMSRSDVTVMAVLAAGVVATSLLLHKEFALIAFNESFARVTGWRVSAIDLVLLALVVVATVIGLQAVGVVMVIAMLIIPAVSARFWSDRLLAVVVLAACFGGMSCYLGCALSAVFPNVPTGAVIVLTGGGFFLFSALAAPARGVLAGLLARATFRIRIAGEHALEFIAADSPAVTERWSRSRIADLIKRRAWPVWLFPLVTVALTARGYIEWRRLTPSVSEAGRRRGRRVERNHRLWEQYLISHADVAPNHVEWSVDQVEHILLPGQVEQLERELDARGIKIPDAGHHAGGNR